MTARRLLSAGLALASLAFAAPSGAGSQRTVGDSDSWMTTWQNDDEKKFGYGLVDPAQQSTFLYGQQKDFDQIERLRKNGDGAVLYVRDGSKQYLVEDAATIREAQTIVEPLLLISREQGKLGSMQGALGNEQGKIGKEQGKIGKEQAQIGKKQGQVGVQQSAAALDDDDEASELLSDTQSELGADQEELGRRQASLGRHQATMGDMQADLGRRQAELAHKAKEIQPGVNAKMKELVKKAIADGKARRI